MPRFEWPWHDYVVPFRMERVAADVEALHFGLADSDAFLIGLDIECAFSFDAIADNHCDSVSDLRMGITPASMTDAPQKADDRRLT